MIRILLGFVIGAGLVIAGLNFASDRLPPWLGGRDAPLTIAAISLEAVQRQPRLDVLTARFDSAIPGQPGTIRYTLDLSSLKVETMRWDVEGRTLTIYAPRPQIAGPDLDPAVLTADVREKAQDPIIARQADENARDAVQRMFLLPLLAGGHSDIKVKVTFAAPPPTSAPAPEQD